MSRSRDYKPAALAIAVLALWWMRGWFARIPGLLFRALCAVCDNARRRQEQQEQ